MRVSSIQIFNNGMDSIRSAQTRLVEANQRVLNEGRRIAFASDDPVRAIQGSNIRAEISRIQQYITNTNSAQDLLSQEATQLRSTEATMKDIHEAMIRANSDVKDVESRKQIAAEMRQKLAELVNLINKTDENGDFIFSGFSAQKKPYTLDPTGDYVYNGDQGNRKVVVASGVEIIALDSGFDVFEGVRTGNGNFVTNASTTNTGTGVIDIGFVSDTSTYVPDTYTIQITGVNSQGQPSYTVRDGLGDLVVPAPGATLPDDAPSFVAEGAIEFNGISVAISGKPQENDTFTITPSENKSVLNIVKDAINNIETPFKGDVQSAKFQNDYNTALKDILQAADHIRSIQSTVGARKNALEGILNTHTQFNVDLVERLKTVEDIDQVEALSEQAQQLGFLQIMQQSFVRMQNLSLFNFMN